MLCQPQKSKISPHAGCGINFGFQRDFPLQQCMAQFYVVACPDDSMERKPEALNRPDSAMAMTYPIWNKGVAHSVS
jgi:hypothetical protein